MGTFETQLDSQYNGRLKTALSSPEARVCTPPTATRRIIYPGYLTVNKPIPSGPTATTMVERFPRFLTAVDSVNIKQLFYE
jgi:hypothetical protein